MAKRDYGGYQPPGARVAVAHTHVYRAVPGAGWACIFCDRPTVTRPPKEQSAAYVERLIAEARHGDRACKRHQRGIRHDPHLWDGLLYGAQQVVDEGPADYACNGAPLGSFASDEEWAEAEKRRKERMD